MSESTELSSLPLFPLAVVLVPGELLPLHVFEERYKAMMTEALDGEKRFGLHYVAHAEVGRDSMPAVGSVGCIAHITAVVPLPDGRMNVLTIGAGRYVVKGYSQYEPFLVAEVDPLSDEPTDDDEIGPLADEVRDLFSRLAAAARALSNESSDAAPPKLDVEPEALSFMVAANVALESEPKQRMLEMTDTVERLESLRERLHELVGTYEYRAEMHTRSKSNGHGTKLPDLDEDDDE